MNIWLRFRLTGVVVVTGVSLLACSGTGERQAAPPPSSAAPGASSPSQPAHSSPSAQPSQPAATTGGRTPSKPAPDASTSSGAGGVTPVPGLGRLQPIWPFTTPAQVQAWQRDYRRDGHQPWHLDPEQTALSFARGYLGFSEIDRVTSRTVTATQARIGVGVSGPESSGSAAVVRLVRYGTGRDAPWEVVGTDDTTFSLTKPAYGSVVRSPLAVGGRISGVDESLRIQVRQPSSQKPLGESCCVPAGGSGQPWSSSVSFKGAKDAVLTVVASTGGHIAEVERFTVTAVRLR
ncbi:hypothetical protein [Streptomyces ficellus]|uniref:Uncharacterized protein n=1 Tax=Streptomyces ficellus TaxID=1977088 RepID=A0A6I6FH76_9ACTN|nr:hypothetical protein [Streptomyces ficellus]QGV76908.1 hypothetical protein EIZ62_00495 [Streptomyces ficellus]